MAKSIIGAAALFVLSACTMPLEKGVAAYTAGNYDEAARNWNTAAASGDPNAQYNVGLLWSQGLGSTPKDANQAMQWFAKAANQGHLQAMVALARHQLAANQPDAALSWLNLAARWNDAAAIRMLTTMGAPVPHADLFAASQQAQAQAGYALGCALAGGCMPRSVSPLAIPGLPQSTRSYSLVSQWHQGSVRNCRYANNAVLVMGSQPCPSAVSGQ